MKIELKRKLAAGSPADARDVQLVKKALNRLGYYRPLAATGITGVLDRAVFVALKEFQKDRSLRVTGEMRPDDETARALSAESDKTPEGFYTWRTAGDNRVRASHAELEGEVRSWKESPDPGEEINCRCWADSAPRKEGWMQEVISEIDDDSRKWTNQDFIEHFYLGNGEAVTLSQIGLLNAIIEHAKKIMFDDVLQQVKGAATKTRNGVFKGSWKNSYSFGDVAYSLGGSVVSGQFSGEVTEERKILTVKAEAIYKFSDTFTDPLNKRQKKTGSSALENIPYDFSKSRWSPGNIAAGYFAADTEYLGTPYDINGEWVTKIMGAIKA